MTSKISDTLPERTAERVPILYSDSQKYVPFE
jgi:hypothetical protein